MAMDMYFTLLDDQGEIKKSKTDSDQILMFFVLFKNMKWKLISKLEKILSLISYFLFINVRIRVVYTLLCDVLGLPKNKIIKKVEISL